MVSLAYMVQVGVAFTPGTSSDAFNVRGTHDPAMTYYRSIVAVLACARRWNPHTPLFLATTAPPPPETRASLDSIAVEVDLVPFDRRPPPGLTPRFSASLYLLDVLHSARCRSDVLIIDPDCAVVRELPTWPAGSVAAHLIDYPADREINGLTQTQAQSLHAELFGERIVHPARYYGGEALWVPSARLDELTQTLDEAHDFALARHRAGRVPWFRTEEHLLTAAARVVPFADLDGVRRIWTARRYRNTRADDLSLALWHVPAEKDRGLVALHRAATDPTGWFWTEGPQAWRSRAARTLGILPSARRRFEHQVAKRVRRTRLT